MKLISHSEVEKKLFAKFEWNFWKTRLICSVGEASKCFSDQLQIIFFLTSTIVLQGAEGLLSNSRSFTDFP